MNLLGEKFTNITIFIVIFTAVGSTAVIVGMAQVLNVRAADTVSSSTAGVSIKMEIFTVIGYSAQSPPRTNITKIILSTRLAAGSPDIDMDRVIMVYNTDDDYITNITQGGKGSKAFSTDFTWNTTADNILEKGETVDIHYNKEGMWLNLSHGDSFLFTIQPPNHGVVTTIEYTVPSGIPYAYTLEWA